MKGTVMTDRVALITGGNKGLGLACAHRLAASPPTATTSPSSAPTLPSS
jgi:NAD(P)-dependent dehydrogenase (short-subunit alcohol dehydrogenase family)